MALAPARVSMPSEAKKGDVIEIKALIRHLMETGYRVDSVGRPIPRHIIKRFSARYSGEEVFAMEMTQGVAANPFIAFTIRVDQPGDLVFTWEDENGEVITVNKSLTVTS
jgi:sulfur-oxidizing protein SoxZ